MRRNRSTLPMLRRRQHRQVGPTIAIEEVEDVVPGRIGAGAERRPGDRRTDGIRRSKSAVAARLREPAEVRKLSCLQEAFGQPRILAVEADDDEPPDQRTPMPLAAEETPRPSETARRAATGRATMTVVRKTKKDESRAKPAPGPMYASAGDGL